jgi:hypothetical protein
MQVSQTHWEKSRGWSDDVPGPADPLAQWLLVFGSGQALRDEALVSHLRERYPKAVMTGCSTSGEICGTQVLDDSLVATGIHFEHCEVRWAHARVDGPQDSHRVGASLAQALDAPGLTHVLVFSDGLNINGTAFAEGLRENLPASVAVTGGLAGDGDRFEHTFVCVDGQAQERSALAIGFHGPRLRIGHGSLGGWDGFGPQRLITRSEGNVLYELDGRSALDLYKQYLGDHAAGLPASALLFPLSLHSDQAAGGLVRTVLGVNEQDKSMTFAGDLPQGSYARLMKANFDRLVDGAAGAARAGLQALDSFSPDLALLISCVGRKLVLKQRVEEEIDSVREVLGPRPVLAGFYSYGEICPNGTATQCELHNQTMTITTFAET